MAKLKINPLGNGIEIEHGTQTVSELVDQFLEGAQFSKDEKILSNVIVVVNGLELDSCFWSSTIPLISDSVLISFKLKGGDFGQSLKQFATIALMIVSIAYPAVAPYAMAAVLALNYLIPPLDPEDIGNAGRISDKTDSQMYSISSQRNSLKPYGQIPKVYGEHRMFPNIAASPYTELAPDEEGKLAQYLYTVYDFGLGEMNISDIKIGDTRIDKYTGISYGFVNLTKTDAEGQNKFQIYLGSHSTQEVGVSLTGSAENSDPQSTWRVERTTTAGPEQQTISVDFRFPEGVYSLGTHGDYGSQKIALQGYYKMEDIPSSPWYPIGYANSYYSFQGSGASPLTTRQVYIPPPNTPGIPYKTLSSTDIYISDFEGTPSYARTETLKGYAKGDLFFYCYIHNTTNTYGFIQDFNYSWLMFGGDRVALLGIPDVLPGDIFRYPIVYQGFSGFKNDIDLFKIDSSDGWVTSKPIYVQKSTIEFEFQGSDRNSQFYSLKFKPHLPGRVTVRIDKVREISQYSWFKTSECQVTTIRTSKDIPAIIKNKSQTFLEIRIKATDQLSGSIQNLNAVCTSILNTWDGATWTKQATTNPAWIFTDILTGEINKDRLDIESLDLPSILSWANYCSETPTPPTGKTYIYPRYQSNFVLDYSTSVQAILSQVSNSCQASLNVLDGKYGVMIDRLRETPVQIFTPRNYSSFSCTRTMKENPHALRIKFIDKYQEWNMSELICYYGGYTVDNTTEILDVETFGVTNTEQAYRYGKFLMAQSILRKESISIEVDFEHLVCTRGDYVQLTSDVMIVGGHPSRVKSITGSIIILDDGFEVSGLEDYVYTLRKPSGIFYGTIDMTSSDEGEILSGELPEEGDLIIISESETQTFDCIVKSITPSSDLKATLELVEKADGIYTSESESEFPEYSPRFSNTASINVLTPGPVVSPIISDNTWECFGGRYQYYANLSWQNPANSIFERFEIYANYGSGYSLAGITQANTFKYIFDSQRLGIPHSFKVLAVSVTGYKLPLAEATEFTATPTAKSTRPSDVSRIDLNITLESMTIEWQRIEDCDAKEYIIRYSPTLDAIWEESIPLARMDSNSSSITQMARTGTYLIKAVDWNGTESNLAAKSSTTIPNLFNLNFVAETNDFPLVPGILERTYSDGTSVILKEKTVGGVGTNEYYSDGYYYYENFLDLGEIYTVRLQSLIQAQGFTKEDLMANWITLDSVAALSNSKSNEWDVETQVRTRDSFTSIASWDVLADVLAMNDGEEGDWGPWRKFTISDFTGRIFDFRLKLISNKASVSPRVFDGIIRADMPDRIDSYNNILVPVGPYDFTYDARFMGPSPSPTIQVTQDSMSQGDYYVISNKTLNGFTIQFFDKDNNTVSRTADFMIRGFGRLAFNSL